MRGARVRGVARDTSATHLHSTRACLKALTPPPPKHMRLGVLGLKGSVTESECKIYKWIYVNTYIYIYMYISESSVTGGAILAYVLCERERSKKKRERKRCVIYIHI